MKYLLTTTAKGETVLSNPANGSSSYALAEGDRVAETVELDITHPEFVQLLHKSIDNHLRYDKITRKVHFTPKTMPHTQQITPGA